MYFIWRDNTYVYFDMWLLQLNVMCLWLIHVTWSCRQSWSLLYRIPLVNTPQFILLLIKIWVLSRVHLLCIDSMNVLLSFVKHFLHIYDVYRYLEMKLLGHGDCVYSFLLEKSQRDFQRGCTKFTLPLAVFRILLAVHLHQHLVFSVFLLFSEWLLSWLLSGISLWL